MAAGPLRAAPPHPAQSTFRFAPTSPMTLHTFSSLLGYIGPETILPLTSALAAIGGGVMLFWTTIRRWTARLFRRTGENASKE